MANKHNPPAFQFYVKDWLSSANVRLMTPAQRGCLVNLLAYSWPDGIPYGTEDARGGLWALAGMPDAASWDKISALVLAQFVEKDGCLKHPKLDDQFKDLSVYHRMQKEKAKKGADARWHGSGKGRALPADASSSSPSSSVVSSSSYSEKIEPIRIRQDADGSLSNQEDDKDNPNPTAERPDSDDELNPLSDENSLLLANIFQELTGVSYEASFEQFIQWRGTTSAARLALLMWWAFRVSTYWSKPESWTVLDAANFLRAHRTLETQFLKWPSADKLIEKFPTTQSILDLLSPPAEEETADTDTPGPNDWYPSRNDCEISDLANEQSGNPEFGSDGYIYREDVIEFVGTQEDPDKARAVLLWFFKLNQSGKLHTVTGKGSPGVKRFNDWKHVTRIYPAMVNLYDQEHPNTPELDDSHSGE